MSLFQMTKLVAIALCLTAPPALWAVEGVSWQVYKKSDGVEAFRIKVSPFLGALGKRSFEDSYVYSVEKTVGILKPSGEVWDAIDLENSRRAHMRFYSLYGTPLTEPAKLPFAQIDHQGLTYTMSADNMASVVQAWRVVGREQLALMKQPILEFISRNEPLLRQSLAAILQNPDYQDLGLSPVDLEILSRLFVNPKFSTIDYPGIDKFPAKLQGYVALFWFNDVRLDTESITPSPATGKTPVYYFTPDDPQRPQSRAHTLIVVHPLSNRWYAQKTVDYINNKTREFVSRELPAFVLFNRRPEDNLRAFKELEGVKLNGATAIYSFGGEHLLGENASEVTIIGEMDGICVDDAERSYIGNYFSRHKSGVIQINRPAQGIVSDLESVRLSLADKYGANAPWKDMFDHATRVIGPLKTHFPNITFRLQIDGRDESGKPAQKPVANGTQVVIYNLQRH